MEEKIKMRAVSSSNIAKVGYDDQSKVLVVQFTNGTTYHYTMVAKADYLNMLAADSIGKFFRKNIANKYKFDKQK